MRITTEHIYFGGYALVISVSLITIYFARKAAKTQDLEEAKKQFDAQLKEKTKELPEKPEGNQEDE